LLAELKRDRKKTAVMAVLLLVALVAVGRLFLRSAVPTKAAAAPAAGKAAPAARASSAQRSDSGEDRSGESGRERVKYLGPIDTTIKRDIFAANPKYFPAVVKPDVASHAAPSGMDDINAERAAIQAKALELALQSTVVSANPTAIIEGQVLHVGDWVNGFRVVEIGSRQCTLEKSGVKVTIEMK
jgi:hypothetical protein